MAAEPKLHWRDAMFLYLQIPGSSFDQPSCNPGLKVPALKGGSTDHWTSRVFQAWEGRNGDSCLNCALAHALDLSVSRLP